MTILGPDVSHYQGVINWSQVKASSGRDFCAIKATEGTGYVDPMLATNRRNAHAAGLIVGFYHFARAGDPAAEAAYFLRTVGALQAGEFLVLDWEVPAPNPPGWCKAWLDAVYAATGVRPLIYMNQSAATGSNWSAVAKDYGLWLAKYDNSTAQPSIAPWSVAMKQYYDKGSVVGIPGPCDVNVFYGTREQLLAYGKGGTPPTPPPIVQEDDMERLVDPNGTIWLWSASDLTPTSDTTLSGLVGDLNGGAAPRAVTWAQLDAVKVYEADRQDRALKGTQNYILGAQPTNDQKPWLFDRIVGLGDAVKTLQSGSTVDPVALAKALLADDAAVAKLGDAIAAGLATRVHNG